jgi:superfamily II RNA helicase
LLNCDSSLTFKTFTDPKAAKNIGNTDLENKFSESIKLLKRDIVFAASLYL